MSIEKDCNNNIIDKKIIRKLGAAELIYDYEHSIGNIILSHAFKVSSKLDLFEHISSIDRAIFNWKQINALLRCKIITLATDNNKLISSEKYLSFADEEKINSSENVFFVSLKESNSDRESNAWRILYDREYNIPFVDVENGLLWRLTFFRLNDSTFYIYFTIHHAIVDARNVYCIIEDLLNMILLEVNGKSSIKGTSDFVEPDIEVKVQMHGPKNYEISSHHDKEFTEFGKIPDSFRSELPVISNFDNNLFKTVQVSNGNIVSCDLIPESIPLISRTKSVILNKEMLDKLLKKCKQNDTKLTGCMHLVAILAARQLYTHYKTSQEYLNKIQYHFIANLRPFFNPPLSNIIMGYFAVVFNGVFDTDVDFDNFWIHAKNESDMIHLKIKNNEHFENAKHDGLLLDEINSGKIYKNTCVHFALSNLGVMNTQINENRMVNIEEHYFGTSCQRDRWSAYLFHGLTTVNNQLCWSITYNPEFIREEIAERIRALIENILNEILT